MDIGRRRFHTRTPIGLLVTLGILSCLVLVIQNPSLITRPSARFVGQVAFSPDGKTLAWTSEGDGEGRVIVWDLVNHRQRLLIGPRASERDRGAVSTYTFLAFSPDGRTLATATRSTGVPDSRIILWNAETGQSRQILRGHTDALSALDYSPDGNTLASASRDRTVKLWDVATGRTLATLSIPDVPVTSIAFSPDGRLLATGWADRFVRVWEVTSGQLSATLSGHTQAIACVAFVPDGRTLASSGFDNTLRFWDLESRRQRSAHTGFPNTCRSIICSPDGKTLAIKFAETSDGALWDVEAGQVRSTFAHAAAGLAFAPDGRVLAIGGGAGGRVFLIELAPAGPPPSRVSTDRH
jgi:WD40 repeat protein